MVKYNVIIIYYIKVFQKTDYAVRLPSHLNAHAPANGAIFLI